MADTTYSQPQSRHGFLARLWQGLLGGMTAYIERKARTERIARLRALSDTELARLGIERRDIPRYVFRDRVY